MPAIARWEGTLRGAWRVAAAAALLLVGTAGGVGAQGSDGLGGADGGGAVFVVAPGAGRVAPSEEGDGDEELLFAGGPREPGVLSAEGTMIGVGGAKVAEPTEDGDAVAALVASVIAGEKASEPVVEDAASGGEPREGSRSLLRSLGELLGLSRDE